MKPEPMSVLKEVVAVTHNTILCCAQETLIHG